MLNGVLNEDALVDALRALLGPAPARVTVGIGDDAAAWQPSRSHRSVISTDASVEGVHFERAQLDAREIGWRAMAASASDLAAMGARGVLATVTLGIPPGMQAAYLLDLYRGMSAASAPEGIAIVGGDLTRAPALTLGVTVVGEVRPSNLKRRDGAKPGDVLVVTGPLGASRAGLHAFAHPQVLPPGEALQARRAYATPEPRLREGRWLAASANVHAMMDISDGLSTDLGRLCRSSGTGARVESVPVAPCAHAMARALGEEPQAYALAGGEDFELLAAVAPRAYARLATRFAAAFGRKLYRIGVVRGGSEPVVWDGVAERPLEPTGWDHLHG